MLPKDITERLELLAREGHLDEILGTLMNRQPIKPKPVAQAPARPIKPAPKLGIKPGAGLGKVVAPKRASATAISPKPVPGAVPAVKKQGVPPIGRPMIVNKQSRPRTSPQRPNRPGAVPLKTS
jgi:hypothetical protein